MSAFSETLFVLIAAAAVMALAVAARQRSQACGIPPLVDDSEPSLSVPSPQAALEECTGSPRVGSAGVALVRAADPFSPGRVGCPTTPETEIGQVAA